MNRDDLAETRWETGAEPVIIRSAPMPFRPYWIHEARFGDAYVQVTGGRGPVEPREDSDILRAVLRELAELLLDRRFSFCAACGQPTNWWSGRREVQPLQEDWQTARAKAVEDIARELNIPVEAPSRKGRCQ